MFLGIQEWARARSLFEIGLFVVTWTIYLSWLYQLLIGLAGWKGAKRYPPARSRRRFAVIIAAHNEEEVVGNLIDCLKQQTYPTEWFDVYVSCDNCTDHTVDVVRSHGAIALIREDPLRRGKTWNVRWALQQIDLNRYYGVVLLDADNLVHAEFLERINDQCDAHGQVDAIQGYLDAKNPDDSWITRSYALMYWYGNRFWELARANLGLSAYLGGTGLMISTECIRRVGWDPESLTEDLEFSAKLILAGGKVLWNEWAVIYDEKPTTSGASLRQRTRWIQGHYWVMWRYGPRTLWRFFTTLRFQYLELFLYLISPGQTAVSYLLVLAGTGLSLYRIATAPVVFAPDIWWLVGLVTPFVQTLYLVIVSPSLRFRRLTFKYTRALVDYIVFGYTWMPVMFKAAFLAHNQGQWVKTEHTRSLTLSQMAEAPSDR